MQAHLYFTDNGTVTGFSKLSLGTPGSPTQEAARDNNPDRLMEVWVKASWLEPTNDTDSVSCPCYSEWSNWCTRYYSRIYYSSYSFHNLGQLLNA